MDIKIISDNQAYKNNAHPTAMASRKEGPVNESPACGSYKPMTTHKIARLMKSNSHLADLDQTPEDLQRILGVYNKMSRLSFDLVSHIYGTGMDRQIEMEIRDSKVKRSVERRKKARFIAKFGRTAINSKAPEIKARVAVTDEEVKREKARISDMLLRKKNAVEFQIDDCWDTHPDYLEGDAFDVAAILKRDRETIYNLVKADNRLNDEGKPPKSGLKYTEKVDGERRYRLDVAIIKSEKIPYQPSDLDVVAVLIHPQ